jgi:transposase
MPRAYSQEFKDRAIDLVLTEGIPVRIASSQLGISAGGLDRWVRVAKLSRGLVNNSIDKLSTSQLEIQQLKKEIRRLKDELEITRRAAALFARDSVFPK